MNTLNRDTYRLLDANMNRAVEGIRILEETARMFLNDIGITTEIKEIRHSLTSITRRDKSLADRMLLARDSEHDVLRDGVTNSERDRTDVMAIIRANAGRAQEAVRALEEYVKLVHPDLSVQFKSIRFRLYDLEKNLAALLLEHTLTSRERLGVFVIIDYERNRNVDISELTGVISGAGAGTVVYRDKISGDRDFMKNGEIMASICKKNGVSTMMNDRLDIALILEAEGVLAGPFDTPVESCRKISGRGFVCGFSLYHCAENDYKLSEGADYLLSKPLAFTPEESVSRDTLKNLISHSSVPVVALCMNPEVCGEIYDYGAAGIGYMPEYPAGLREIEKVIGTLKKLMKRGESQVSSSAGLST
jgi:thiamine-phosphate pyrophosphorylase